MNGPRWSLHGFVFASAIPLMCLSMLIILETRDAIFPPLALASLYSLGTLFFTASPWIFKPGSYEPPEAHIQFSKGAKYATWTTALVGFPVALVSIVYNQFLIGLSLFLIALGSTPLPDISVAGTYGYLLVRGTGTNEFFSRASKWIFDQKMRIIFWLSLLLKRRDLLKRLSVVGNVAVLPFYSFLLGWIVFSIAGGFPATLVGIALGPAVPISCYASIRRRLTREEREQLGKLLARRAPTPRSFGSNPQPAHQQEAE